MGTDEGKNDRLEYSHARRKLAVALELLNREAPRSNYLDNSIVTGRDARIYRDLLLRHGEQVFGPKLLDIACSALGSQRKLSFLQVGANDGITNDPIHQLVRVFGETVVLIEPISDIIPELKKNYQDFSGKVIVENVAVSAGHNEYFELHVLAPKHWAEYIENWGDHPTMIASYARESVVEKVSQRLRISSDEANAMVENRSVPVKSLDQIVATHGLTTLDVLQIDAEGHDVRILESLTSLMPALVNFESMNLTGADWERFRDWAARHGYGFVRGFQDTLAIRGCHFEAE